MLCLVKCLNFKHLNILNWHIGYLPEKLRAHSLCGYFELK